MGVDMAHLTPLAVPNPAIPASLCKQSDAPVPSEDDVPALVASTSSSIASSVASSEADDDLPDLADASEDMDEDQEEMEDPALRHVRAKEAATILLSQMLQDGSSDSATPSWEWRSRWATPKALSSLHLSRLGLEPLQLMVNTPPSTIVPPSKATSVYCLDDDEEELPPQQPSSGLFLRLQ